MNTNPFNTQTYNATPSISSANGMSDFLNFGVLIASIGMPVISKFTAVNYIKSSLSNTAYIKPVLSNTNYIKG